MSPTTETPPSVTPAPAAAGEDRTVAIVAYITIIGLIVAVIMHSSKKTALGTYHLRQSLGLYLTAICASLVLACIPFVGWMLIPFLTLGVVVMAIIGLVAALNGEQKPLPLLGDKYAQWFANAFV
jgi:uncharacterized membrane protein